MATEFAPVYFNDDRGGGDDAGVFVFTRSQFYDMVYAAREAHIRFKRLRTKTRAEEDTMDAETFEYRMEECNTMIQHYASMETFLREKYKAVFNEDW